MVRRSFIVVVLVAGVASVVVSAALGSARRSAQESVATSVLMPGVTYTREVDFTLRGPIVLDVVTAPKPDGKLFSLAPALSNNASFNVRSPFRLAVPTTSCGGRQAKRQVFV